MTLHVTRDGDKITIHGNINSDVTAENGRITHVGITEDVRHVRQVWGQLGRLLAEAEGTTPGQRLYERYSDHTDGTSLVNGDQLPSWPENEQKYRDAWEHTAGA